jgi:hypothetical protein
MIGTRDVSQLMESKQAPYGQNLTFSQWLEQTPGVSLGTFAQAAAFGDLAFNCTNGAGALDALEMAGEANLNGKILVDISNPLDFSRGMPPSLTVCNTDSLGEQIQRTFPGIKVVKTLNTVNAFLMVDAHLVADGEHHMFLCGNDAEAKAEVGKILKDWFGWRNVLDLGDITNARAMEMYLPLWLRLMGAVGAPIFNILVVK